MKLYRLYRPPEPGGTTGRLMRITGTLTMIRTVLIAVAAIAATVAATEVAAQSGTPVRKLTVAPAGTPTGTWIVVRGGEREVSHCIVGPRSDAPNPQPGKPQFMIAVDREIVLLRVRAADWSFPGARDIAVTLATADGVERQPAAAVHGNDLIDVDLGSDAQKVSELAALAHLEIRTEGTVVRLLLDGLSEALPAYRTCVASIGQPIKPELRIVAAR